jgi:hypothetical protein
VATGPFASQGKGVQSASLKVIRQSKLAADLNFNSGRSELDPGTPFAPEFISVFATLLASFPSAVGAALGFDATFLTNPADAALTTHAVCAGCLRDQRRGGKGGGRDCKGVDSAHLKAPLLGDPLCMAICK